MSPGIKKAIHVIGVICGLAAGVIMIAVGIVEAADRGADGIAPGKLICFGIAGLASTIVAIVDGARAFPQAGIWRIGGKFEGLGDMAVVTIVLILGAGIGVSFAFN